MVSPSLLLFSAQNLVLVIISYILNNIGVLCVDKTNVDQGSEIGEQT